MFIDSNGMRSKEIADQIIRNNANNFINAGREFGVNPGILAATVYAEQALNVDWKDDWSDLLANMFDTSIGVAQVRVSTALMLEEQGYMKKTSALIVNGTEQVSRWEYIALKLTDEQYSIRYAAAYLKYYQERWKEVYPEIDGKTDILATLYNQGEIKAPHSNPIPTEFGVFAKNNYFYVRELIGLE